MNVNPPCCGALCIPNLGGLTAENAGKGVLKVEGRMVERLHLAEAERLIAISQAIAALQG
jgi:hypothetical protein